MCWCDPSIRTPNCGKPTCVPPVRESREVQLSPRELSLIAEARSLERKRCIAICEAEERKYIWMTMNKPDTFTWAGERGIGAGDCARKIANVTEYP